jgi:hypothetical protein
MSGNQFENPTSAAGYQAILPEYDWRLTSTSACINAGNNAVVFEGADLAGNARIQKTTVDLGAYETDYDTPAPTGIKRAATSGFYFHAGNNTLYFSENMDAVSIYNVNGTLVLKKNRIANILDVSDLDRGIYIVVGTKDNTTLTYKFVK